MDTTDGQQILVKHNSFYVRVYLYNVQLRDLASKALSSSKSLEYLTDINYDDPLSNIDENSHPILTENAESIQIKLPHQDAENSLQNKEIKWP